MVSVTVSSSSSNETQAEADSSTSGNMYDSKSPAYPRALRFACRAVSGRGWVGADGEAGRGGFVEWGEGTVGARRSGGRKV